MMNSYKKMLELLATEPLEKVRKLLKAGAETIILGHLKSAGEEESGPSLHPDSAEAMDATMAESEQMDSALATWAQLSLDERGRVAELLEKAGWEDARFDLLHDLDMRLPN